MKRNKALRFSTILFLVFAFSSAVFAMKLSWEPKVVDIIISGKSDDILNLDFSIENAYQIEDFRSTRSFPNMKMLTGVHGPRYGELLIKHPDDAHLLLKIDLQQLVIDADFANRTYEVNIPGSQDLILRCVVSKESDQKDDSATMLIMVEIVKSNF